MIQDDLLPNLPDGLRSELFSEFRGVIEGFSEGRWRSSALDAGRFCEVCYTILAGLKESTYPSKASKPNDFRGSCRKLESDPAIPKSFWFIMIPNIATLYEIRNTRNVGHVDRDVDPSFMDGSLVVASVKWIMAVTSTNFLLARPKAW